MPGQNRTVSNRHPPSKNRVWDFFATFTTSVWNFVTQPVEPHRETFDTSTFSASGVLFYGYRYYSPGLGRWVSRDPIEERGGLNLFIIASNNTTDSYDKLGHRGGNAVPSGAISPNPVFPGPQIPSPLPTTGVGSCGPDVTIALDATIAEIMVKYAHASRWEKCQGCFNLLAYPSIWEISPLYLLGTDQGHWDAGNSNGYVSAAQSHMPGGYPGVGACVSTVQYHGKCYRATNLNLALFGTATRLCGIGCGVAGGYAYGWKAMGGYFSDAAKSLAVTEGTWLGAGLAPGGGVMALGAESQCSCGSSSSTLTMMHWHWDPIKL